MARPPSGFYSTIEYIGPRPQKPRRRNFFGGWVIIVIALAMGVWFARPLMPFLRAAQVGASTEQAVELISSLEAKKSFADGLAAAALKISAGIPGSRLSDNTNGDAPIGKGVSADVVVRGYRSMDMDLATLLHEDMTENFRLYPQLWGASGPDETMDHRRVPNLQRFFERKGERITPTRNAADYLPGDIVVWSLGNAENHIGIVVPSPGGRTGEAWVVHNMGGGAKWDNILFDYSIQRHFRFPGKAAE